MMCESRSNSATYAGPTIAATGICSTVTLLSRKWSGESTCVPVCDPSASALTFILFDQR